jgi:3-oxoacyl-[acyl-carrier-protein] synthase-1
MTSQGFASLEAVSPGYCRPFDIERDGINLGEGGALLALSRCSPEDSGVVLAGYGESIDAWHISAPHPEGDGIARAMRSALAMAGYQPSEVGYVNMHGTGTLHNDIMEAKAVIDVLGAAVPVSSTKPMTGHTLGAAGALEAAICYALLQGDLEALPIQHGMQTQDSQFEQLQVITEASRRLNEPVVMSNSCGFGGHNTCLVLALRAN